MVRRPCLLVYRSINTLMARQNGRHFPDDIFKWIFLNEIIWISIKISLRLVPTGRINNIPADQATSHYLNQWWLVHWCIYASLGLNQLTTDYLPLCNNSCLSWVNNRNVYSKFRRQKVVCNWVSVANSSGLEISRDITSCWQVYDGWASYPISRCCTYGRMSEVLLFDILLTWQK